MSQPWKFRVKCGMQAYMFTSAIFGPSGMDRKFIPEAIFHPRWMETKSLLVLFSVLLLRCVDLLPDWLGFGVTSILVTVELLKATDCIIRRHDLKSSLKVNLIIAIALP